MIKIINIQ